MTPPPGSAAAGVTTPCESCGAPVVSRYCTACGTRRRETAAEVDAMTADGRRATWVGLAGMLGGMLVSFATFRNAGPGGGFVVLTGAIVFGLLRMASGLRTMWQAHRLPRT